MNSIKNLIMENNTKENLRVYINALCEGKKSWEPGAQECELLLIAFLCSEYKQNLIDPIDKPESFETTLLKVVESIHRYFSES